MAVFQQNECFLCSLCHYCLSMACLPSGMSKEAGELQRQGSPQPHASVNYASQVAAKYRPQDTKENVALGLSPAHSSEKVSLQTAL